MEPNVCFAPDQGSEIKCAIKSEQFVRSFFPASPGPSMQADMQCIDVGHRARPEIPQVAPQVVPHMVKRRDVLGNCWEFVLGAKFGLHPK